MDTEGGHSSFARSILNGAVAPLTIAYSTSAISLSDPLGYGTADRSETAG
jgi:hypothetical protein